MNDDSEGIRGVISQPLTTTESAVGVASSFSPEQTTTTRTEGALLE